MMVEPVPNDVKITFTVKKTSKYMVCKIGKRKIGNNNLKGEGG